MRIRQIYLAVPRRWHKWLALLSAFVPLLCGLLLSYWHARRAMELEAQAQAMRAVVEVDRMLVNASQTARRIGARAGTKCDDLELDLRKQVDSVLFVRSVDVLVDEREIYCSSLYGVYHKTIDLSAYVDGRLRLQPHSGTSPDSTLLIYRWVEGGRGAVVTIDGRHVRDALQLLGRNGDGLILDVGGKLLGADGLKSNDASIGGDVIFERSATFPFRVWAVMPKGVLLNRMASDYLGLIIAFGVFGILLGIFVKRGLSHVGSRRHEMSRALRLGEFVPFFQPLVNSSDKRWVGAEVLIRWRHPKEGLVQPDSFIPLAESSGLIVPITRGLFHSVTKALSGVDLPNGFRLSFNISARHMQCASIIEDCEALQRRLNQWRVQLVLELTERELLTSDGATREIFDALHGMGIKVAVDDFGTGHSSLTYLRDFEMDALKIDKSFVAKIGGHPLSERVLDSILDLAKNLELTTIAEGVETWPQAEFLRERGVPILQGYLFGRPMPAEEFVRRLGEHRHGTTSEVCAAIFE